MVRYLKARVVCHCWWLMPPRDAGAQQIIRSLPQGNGLGGAGGDAEALQTLAA